MTQHLVYDFMNELESIFIRRFLLLSIDQEVGVKLKLCMTNVVFHHPCLKFDKDYIIKYCTYCTHQYSFQIGI